MAAGYIRPAGQLDAATALQPYAGAWNDRLAAHLLRRAGFGGTPDEIARVAGLTPGAAVASLMRLPAAAPSAPSIMPYPGPQLRAARALPESQRREAIKAVRKSAIASVVALQTWWLDRMLTTPAPLQEKMTFILHGHFTTAAIQKGVWPNLVYAQNDLFRRNALGNLRDLTLAVSRDPAMLLYLDNAENNKSHPNENYARELMELFTLGIGNYSEEDVRQSARSFTGWTLDRRTGTFYDNPRVHDDGVKTFLGKSGNFDGKDIVDIIYQQRACERFWASTLLNAFVYNDPEPELVDAYANVISRNRFDLEPSLATLFASNVFFSPRAYRALVKSPVEFVVGAHKSLGISQLAPGMPRALRSMGQVLFNPPNVAGWPGGANWMTSQMLLARENFALKLVNAPVADASLWRSRVPDDARAAAKTIVDTVLHGDAPADAVEQLVAYLGGSGTSALGALSLENSGERVRNAIYLTMAMPAYQLG